MGRACCSVVLSPSRERCGRGAWPHGARQVGKCEWRRESFHAPARAGRGEPVRAPGAHGRVWPGLLRHHLGRRRLHRGRYPRYRQEDAEHGECRQRDAHGASGSSPCQRASGAARARGGGHGRHLRKKATATLPAVPLWLPQICVETMMHLTCTNMPEEKLQSALDEVRRPDRGVGTRRPGARVARDPRPQQDLRRSAAVAARLAYYQACGALCRRRHAGAQGGPAKHPGAAGRPAQGPGEVRGGRGRLLLRAGPGQVHPQDARGLLWHLRGGLPRGAPRLHRRGRRADEEKLLGRHRVPQEKGATTAAQRWPPGRARQSRDSAARAAPAAPASAGAGGAERRRQLWREGCSGGPCLWHGSGGGSRRASSGCPSESAPYRSPPAQT